MKYVFLIPIFILVLSTNAEDEANAGTGIKCYECTVTDLECLSLASFKLKHKFLKSCKSGCAVRVGEYGQMGEYDKYVLFARGCDDLEQCDRTHVNCCKCNFDGCNINNYCNTANSLRLKVIAAIVICTAVLQPL